MSFPNFPMTQKPLLTRKAIQNGEIERLLHNGRNNLRIMSDDERADLVRTTLAYLGKDTGLWIFGYGSLIWNPALEFNDQRRCSVQGYQRKFCFWTTLSRGTEEQPGLMMGLVEGEQCDGLAYKIDPSKAETELDILFRREMVTSIYKPTWIQARCVETDTDFTALTFVVDRTNERYIDSLSQSETVRTLATAQGPLGRNCDYLFDLSRKLRELEFKDLQLEELEQLVTEYQSLQSV